MDNVYGVVREICVFIIITAIVDNLLQGSVYRKYVKLVSGVMITLIIIKPVMNIISVGEIYAGSLDQYTNRLNIEEYGREMKMYNENPNTPSYYTDMLKQSLKSYLETEGYELIDCRWNVVTDINDEMYGSIEGLTVRVRSGGGHTIDEVYIDDNGQIELYNRELADKLAAYYGIAKEKVEVVAE